MKKILTLALAALALASVQAGEKLAVLKDTRQYDDHISAFTGSDGCTLPLEDSTPNPGDCVVKRARYIKTGELLQRDQDFGICWWSAWESELTKLTYQGHEVSAPSTWVRNEVFACDADGKPVEKIQAAVNATQ